MGETQNSWGKPYLGRIWGKLHLWGKPHLPDRDVRIKDVEHGPWFDGFVRSMSAELCDDKFPETSRLCIKRGVEQRVGPTYV